LREFLTIVVPLALPTVLYLAWLQLVNWSAAGGAVRWRAMPFVWLAGAGAALLALVLFTVTVHFGVEVHGTYVAPHLHDGQIVPGHIEPGTRP